MNLNFYLNNPSQNKEQVIYLYIRGISIYKGKTIKMNSNQRILPKFWDNDKQKAKRNFSYSNELNTYLEKFKEKTNIRIMKLLSDDIDYSFVEFRDLLLNAPSKNKDEIIQNIDLFLEAKKNIYTDGSKQKYRTLKMHLENFTKEYDYILTYNNFDLNFFDKFTDYAINKLKLNNNTLHKYIGLLTSFINWSIERELTTINHTSKFKIKGFKTQIVALSESELNQIEELDTSALPYLDRVKDFFLFSIYTGARFSDVSNVEYKDIDMKKKVWKLRTIKTRDLIEIPLSEKAISIINKYKDNPKFLPSITNQKYNNYIKELCKRADISEQVTITSYQGTKRKENTHYKYELISSHTARRTFVTLSLMKGIPAEIIMNVTGHKDYKSFAKYIKLNKESTKKIVQDTWNK